MTKISILILLIFLLIGCTPSNPFAVDSEIHPTVLFQQHQEQFEACIAAILCEESPREILAERTKNLPAGFRKGFLDGNGLVRFVFISSRIDLDTIEEICYIVEPNPKKPEEYFHVNAKYTMVTPLSGRWFYRKFE